MPIKYKINIVEALRDNGYNTNRIRQEKLLGEATVTRLRRGEMISMESICRVCRLLHCQPGDLLEYVEDGDGDGIK